MAPYSTDGDGKVHAPVFGYGVSRVAPATYAQSLIVTGNQDGFDQSQYEVMVSKILGVDGPFESEILLQWRYYMS